MAKRSGPVPTTRISTAEGDEVDVLLGVGHAVGETCVLVTDLSRHCGGRCGGTGFGGCMPPPTGRSPSPIPRSAVTSAAPPPPLKIAILVAR